jgi:hypothetical protein
MPAEVPVGLTPEFYMSKDKQTEWKAFLKRHSLRRRHSLKEASELIVKLVMPAVMACATGSAIIWDWHDQEWHERTVRQADTNS